MKDDNFTKFVFFLFCLWRINSLFEMLGLDSF